MSLVKNDPIEKVLYRKALDKGCKAGCLEGFRGNQYKWCKLGYFLGPDLAVDAYPTATFQDIVF